MSLTAKRSALFAAACAGMFLFGIVGALLGTLFGLPEFRDRFALDFARQGNLFFVLYVGLLATTIVAGPGIDRLGNRIVLLFGALLAGLAFFAFGILRGYPAALVATVALGAGGGALNVATNTAVSVLYPEQRGRMLNYLAAFFGVGALSVPLAVAALGPRVAPAGLLQVAAAVAALCAVAYAALRFPEAQGRARFSLADIPKAAAQPGVLLLSALLFFQTGNEASVSGWISSYIASVGWSARVATGVLALYWAAVVVGRLAWGRVHTLMAGPGVLIVCGVAAVAGCSWLMWSVSLAALVGATLLTALALSGVYPTALAIAGNRYGRHTGTVFGTLFSIGAVGGMITPPALGHLSQAAGLRTGMLVPLGGAIAVALLATVVRRESRRRATGTRAPGSPARG